MSAKIYTAYRLKLSADFWPFTRDVRRKALKRLHVILQQNFLALVPEVSKSPEFNQRLRETSVGADFLLKTMTERRLTEEYRNQSIKSERDPFDFDVSITVREHTDSLYLIPHVGDGARGVLDFLKRDKRLEDFAYWNNTDKPSHITQRAWNYRRAVWDALDSGPTTKGQLHTDTWSDYLVIEICSYTAFWKIKPPFKL